MYSNKKIYLSGGDEEPCGRRRGPAWAYLRTVTNLRCRTANLPWRKAA